MLVHTFGAYFGLMVSYMLRRDFSSSNEGASYTSDIFAMIGTKKKKKKNSQDYPKFIYIFLNTRNNLFVAFLAFIQRWIGRRRCPAPRCY
jgi:hypothetical protein